MFCSPDRHTHTCTYMHPVMKTSVRSHPHYCYHPHSLFLSPSTNNWFFPCLLGVLLQMSWENTYEEFVFSSFLLLPSILLASIGKRNQKPEKRMPIRKEKLQKTLKDPKRPGDNDRVSAVTCISEFLKLHAHPRPSSLSSLWQRDKASVLQPACHVIASV